jgi:uncharacterized protein (DUF111 family)
MRIAYLDCFSGMSGDMFLGALIDAGVPAKLFEDTVAALNIEARLEISRVNRSGILPSSRAGRTSINIILGVNTGISTGRRLSNFVSKTTFSLTARGRVRPRHKSINMDAA